MKKVLALTATLLGLTFSVSSFSQEIAPGAVVRTMNCSLADGASMQEAVEWGRSLQRGENAADSVYYREAVHHSSNFRESYDFQIAWYYNSFTDYFTKMEASRGSNNVRSSAGLMTCNPGSEGVAVSRTVPDTDAYDADQGYMLTRFCRLNEDSTADDAFSYVSGVAGNYRSAGSNSLIWVNTRSIGPVTNLTANGAVLIGEVASSPEELGARMDLGREGANIFANLGDNPFEQCNFPSLWRTHAVHQTAQN